MISPNHKNIAIACAALAAFAAPLAAHAQSQPNVNPGRIEERVAPQPAQPSFDRQGVDIQGADLPAGLNAEAAKITFNLTSVVVEGTTVYSPSDFQALYNSLIGTTVSLADMMGIADKITAKYRKDGYILSRAIVPEQTIKNGVVTIRVVEGFIDKADVQGALGEKNSQLRSYASKISSSKPLNIKTIERYLLLANDLPGITVRSILTRSPTTLGAADLTLIVTRKLVDASVTVDNRGSRYLGPGQVTASAGVNNVLGYNDQLTVQGLKSLGGNELAYASVNASTAIGNEGTRIGVSASESQTKPGFTLKVLDVKGLSDTMSIYASHPWIRSRDQNLNLTARFDHRNSKNETLGTLTSRDRLRVARVGANYEVSDSWTGINVASFQVSQGLDIMDATESGTANLSRALGKSDFTKVNAEYQRLQAIVPDLNVLLGVSGQYAFDNLLASEQYGLGGQEYGRAFDSSEIVGDHGFGTKAELQYNIRSNQNWLQTVQPYAFVDGGRVMFRTPATGERKATSLASTGLGTRFRFTDNVSAYVEMTQPLKKAIATEDNYDPRFFFGVTAKY